MDAAWLALVLAASGVTLDTPSAGEGATFTAEQPAARDSISADLLPAKHGCPKRHVVNQPISSGQLESGFSDATQQFNAAGQNLTRLGQTVQQNATQAQQAFEVAQQQFIPPSTTAPRTVGGELREGAGRLLNRTGDALQKTGEAIGGTARNLRDRFRNALPGRRQEASPLPVTGAPGGFQPFNSQPPAPLAQTGAPLGPNNGGFAGGGLPAASGSATRSSTSAGTAPFVTPQGSGASPGFANSSGATTQPFGNEQSVLATQTNMDNLTPVPPPQIPTTITGGGNQGSVTQTMPGTVGPLQQPGFDQPATGMPFDSQQFQATTRQGFGGSGPTPMDDRMGAGLGAPGGSSAVVSVFDNAPANGPSQGFQPLPSFGQPGAGSAVAATPFQPQQQPGFNQPGFGQPGFGQTVARPTDQFGQQMPVAGPGADQFGNPGFMNPAPPLAAPQNFAGQAGQQFQQAGGMGPLTAGVNGVLPPTTNEQDTREPWRELVFAVVVALGSVGGNLFLGWSYLDARNKYRSALRRTTRTFGRSTAMADD